MFEFNTKSFPQALSGANPPPKFSTTMYVDNPALNLYDAITERMAIACRTGNFDECFAFAVEHKKHEAKGYISTYYGEFFGILFECWEAMQKADQKKGDIFRGIISAAKNNEINLHDIFCFRSSLDCVLGNAIRQNNIHLCHALIAMGADVNGRRQVITPLISAISLGHKEIVSLLLENKADPNFSNVHGETPLLEAVKMGNGEKEQVEILSMLLRYGAKRTGGEPGIVKKLEQEVQAEKEREQQRRQEAIAFMIAAKKSKSLLFKQISENNKVLVGRMIKAASTPRAV